MRNLGILEKNTRELSSLSTVTLFSYYFVNTKKRDVKQLDKNIWYFNFFVLFLFQTFIGRTSIPSLLLLLEENLSSIFVMKY